MLCRFALFFLFSFILSFFQCLTRLGLNFKGWKGFLYELAQVLVIVRVSLQYELLDRCSSVEISDFLDENPEELIDLHFLLPLHLRVH